MKFFVDTANIDEISELSEMGLVDGVTTNPSLIYKSGKDFKDVIKEIAKLLRYLGEKKLSEHFEKLNITKISVIVENDNRARTDGFAKVSLDKDYPSGEILNMVVTGKDKFGLIGKVVALRF